MNGKAIMEGYPKVADVIRKYFNDKMLENLSSDIDTPEEFKNMIRERGIGDEFIINVINKNPSALFEIFDGLQVYIGISIAQLPKTKQVVFNYYICPKGDCAEGCSEDFFTRKDVEYYAMLGAIEYININLIDEI